MVKVGLTGGIGSGKSTVGAMFARLGAHVIDADALARDALAPGGAAYEEAVRAFGQGILAPGGEIDRRALAGIVFADADKRALLESIVHPRVFEEEARITRDIAARDPRAVIVFDVPLLIESGAHVRMDAVVVVWCSRETQVARLVRRGMAREEALRRIDAQMPLDEKRRYADFVIDNEGSLEETERRVGEVFKGLGVRG